jgi:Lrp/AsnC family leucine-responsive transcriptional regulator
VKHQGGHFASPRTGVGGVTGATEKRDSFAGDAGNLARVEDIDRQILRLLSHDGRMSFTDLGRATGLSTSAVHQRVRRLEQRGVIRGYTVVVEPNAVGLSLTAFISVTPLDPAAPDDVPDRLNGIPDIEACHSVAGEENYILKVRCDSPAALESLLAKIRSEASVSTRTTVVLSTPYESRPLPL